MGKHPYLAFVSAKRVAVAWIGAAFGPAFVVVGLDGVHISHLLMGLGLVVFAVFTIGNGIKAFGRGSKSDFSVLAVVPIFLLVAGSVFAWLAYSGSGG